MSWQDLIIPGSVLGVACLTDIAARRIPNVLVALLATAGLWAQWRSSGARGAGAGLLAGAAVFGALFLVWKLGKLGGGDLKLAAAAAVWVGPSRLVDFALFTGAAGLPVALAAWAAHQVKAWRLARAVESGMEAAVAVPPRPTAPLAVAIAAGTLVTLWLGAR